MAVKIKEDRIIDGEMFPDIITYKSDQAIIPAADLKKADKLDSQIEKEMRKIEKELEKNGLLKLKGKNGVVQLWYEVGKRLRSFIETLDLPLNERKYLFRAFYDHAGNLSPGPLSERAKTRPEQSYFSYFYKLGKYEKEKIVGIPWTIWHEVMDSPLFRENENITDWVISKKDDVDGNFQEVFRPVFKAIRNKFKKVNVTVFTDKELFEKLDKIFYEINPKKPQKKKS